MTTWTPAATELGEALGLDGVTVRLGGRTVLDDVSFSIRAGEFTGLIGANGAGKTTLFSVILGLQAPASGSVRLGGGRRSGRDLGYVPQKFLLDPDMPLRGRDLIGLGLDGQRLGVPLRTRERRARVQQMIDAVDAQSFADERVGRLSGGEQQRILIAHALISRPQLLLLDEPLANLDLRSAQEVVGLVSRIAVEQRIAVLISAHEMNPLLPVMDRIVYLAAGRAASGTADEVVRSDVLTALYGHHVDVLRVHGRVLVVAGAGHDEHAELDRGDDHSAPVEIVTAIVPAPLAAIIEPGFFSSSPVRLALVVGALVAIVAGCVGVFTVVRGQSFAGEALGDIGATGGSSAYLAGIAPLWGFVGISVAAAGIMELIGIQRARGRDLATGIVLGAGFGLAALFLYLATTSQSTTGATITILFGSIFALDTSTLPLVAAFGAVALATILMLYRPLLLVSASPELAAARGIPVRVIGGLYLLAMALAVALSAVTIGAILSTALLVGPAATALQLTRRPGRAILSAALLGIGAMWLGILLAYDSYAWPPLHHGWPVSFFVVTLVLIAYLVSRVIAAGRDSS